MHTTVPKLSTRRQVLRAGFAAAVGALAASDVLGAGQASALPPRPSPRISMIGDSLTMGTMPFQTDDFAMSGWGAASIDAYTSRGIRTKVHADRYTGLTAVDAIREKSGDTEAWIIALGTNDAVIYAREKHADVIKMMMDHIGPGHKVMWINVYLPQRQPNDVLWNTSLAAAAHDRPGDMFVYDWATFAADNPRFLAHDKIHYDRDGYRYRSTAIGLASRNLLPDTSGSGLLPKWRLSRMKALS